MDISPAATKQICTQDGKVIRGKCYRYRTGLLMLHVVVVNIWRLQNGMSLSLEVTHSHANMFNMGYLFEAATTDTAVDWQLLDEIHPAL